MRDEAFGFPLHTPRYHIPFLESRRFSPPCRGYRVRRCDFPSLGQSRLRRRLPMRHKYDRGELFSFQLLFLFPSSYFGNVLDSCLSIIQVFTFDEWSTIAKDMVEERPHLSIYFLAVIVVLNFGILNIIIGIFCESNLAIVEEREKVG